MPLFVSFIFVHSSHLSQATNHNFDIESDTFELRNIMEAPLLKHAEEIEDICISAVKERVCYTVLCPFSYSLGH